MTYFIQLVPDGLVAVHVAETIVVDAFVHDVRAVHVTAAGLKRGRESLKYSRNRL